MAATADIGAPGRAAPLLDEARSALAVVCAEPSSLSPAELVTAIVTADRLESLLHGAQSALLAEFSRPGRCGDLSNLISVLTDQFGQATRRDGTVDVAKLESLIHDEATKLAAAEVGAALRISPLAAAGRVNQAVRLVEELPGTHRALLEGRIDRTRAWIMGEKTSILDPDVAQLVEHEVLDHAAALTPGRFGAAVGRAVIAADPEAAQKRADKARKERRVTRRTLPDGIGLVSAFLPAEGALGLYTLLDLIAASNRGIDDRCVDERRADALTDIAGRLLAGDTITIRDLLDLITADPHTDDPDPAGDSIHTATDGADGEDADGDLTHDSADQGRPETDAVETEADLATETKTKTGDVDIEAETNADANAGVVDVDVETDTETDAANQAEANVEAAVDIKAETDAANEAEAKANVEAAVAGADSEANDEAAVAGADDEAAVAESAEAGAIIEVAGTDADTTADAGRLTEEAGAAQSTRAIDRTAPNTSTAQNGSRKAAGRAYLPTRQGRPVHLNVTMSLATMCALDNLPAHLAGYGAMTADWARTIVKAAQSVTLLILDPETGETIGISDRSYRPRQALRDQVTTLQETCSWIGCGQPAYQCDLDHVEPFNHDDPTAGGKTTVINIRPGCRRHHLLKTHTCDTRSHVASGLADGRAG